MLLVCARRVRGGAVGLGGLARKGRAGADHVGAADFMREGAGVYVVGAPMLAAQDPFSIDQKEALHDELCDVSWEVVDEPSAK